MAGKKIPIGVNIIANEQVTKVFDKVRSSIQKVFSSVNKAPEEASKALSATSGAVETTKKAIERDKKGKKKRDIEVNGGGFGSFYKPAKTGADGIEGMTSAARNLMLLLVGSGGITYGMKKISDNISHSVIDLNRLGNRVGLPAKDIRELGFVANAAGVPIESLRQSLTSLADAQFDQKAGIQSEAVKAIAALNSRVSHPVSLFNADGTRRNLKAIYLDTARALGEVKDPSLKARVAGALSGGEEILKLTDMGPERLDAASKRFKVSPFSKELTNDVYKYNNAVTDLNSAMDQLKYTAGGDILKGFSDGLSKSAELITQNNENIKRFSSQLGESLPKAIPATFKALEGLSTTLEKLDQSVGLVNVSLGVLGTYTFFRAIVLAGELTKAITVLKALSIGSVVASAAPVVAGAAIVAGAAYALSKPNTTGIATNYSPRDLHTWRMPSPKPAEPSKADKPNESFVRIAFENAPSGMRIIEKNSTSSDLLVEYGINMGGAF